MQAPRDINVQYLLGELPEEQAAVLEKEYFANDELFERLGAVETDLLDEYVRGELTASERAAFELRLKALPSLRARLESAAALSQGLSLEGSDSLAHPPASPRWARPLAVAAALLIAAAGVWLGSERARLLHGLESLRSQKVALEEENRRLKADLAASQVKGSERAGDVQAVLSVGRAISFVLAAGLWRDVSGANDFRAPRDAGAILLEIPVADRAGWLYLVRIEDASGRLILEQRDLPPIARKAGSVAVVATSPTGLPPGDYAVKLARRRSGSVFEEAANFAFRITYR